GSDANACSQTAPCRTIPVAVGRARPGDTVLAADGHYPPFTLTGVNGTASAPITIRAQTPSTAARGAGRVRGSGVDVAPAAGSRGNIYILNSSYLVVDGLTTFNGSGSLAAGIAVRFSLNVTVQNTISGNNAVWGIFTSCTPYATLINNETYGSVSQHGI